MNLLFLKDNEDGQLSYDGVELELVEETMNYVIPTSQKHTKTITEKQVRRHYSFVSYCMNDGSRSTTSSVQRPKPIKLSSEQLIPNMLIGIFYRNRSHLGGIRALIMQTEAVENDYILVKIIHNRFVNQLINSPLNQFIEHGSNQLSSRDPLPYNSNGKMCQENGLFVSRNCKSVSVCSQNKLVLSVNNQVGQTFFARMIYRQTNKNYDGYRAHTIKLNILTKDMLLDGLLRNLSRINTEDHRNLVYIHVKGGDTYIGMRKNDKTYAIEMIPVTKKVVYHEINEPSLTAHAYTLKPVYVDEWLPKTMLKKEMCPL